MKRLVLTPLTLAMLGGCGSPPVRTVEASFAQLDAGALIRAMEAKIADATSIHAVLREEILAEGADRPTFAKSLEVRWRAPDRLRVVQSTTGPAKPSSIDVAYQATTCWALAGDVEATEETPPDELSQVVEGLRGILARTGAVLAPLIERHGIHSAREWRTQSGPVEPRVTQIVSTKDGLAYEIAFRMRFAVLSGDAEVRLWLGTETLLPIRRVIEFDLPASKHVAVTTEYSLFRVGQPMADVMLAPPQELRKAVELQLFPVLTMRQLVAHVDVLIEIFRLDHRRYPDTLDDLVQKPAYAREDRWPAKGYLRKKPVDPWNRELVYVPPKKDGAMFDLYSLGADGAPGGCGDAADYRIRR